MTILTLKKGRTGNNFHDPKNKFFRLYRKFFTTPNKKVYRNRLIA
jgi:G:T/U-mismatch repair DNA glycosylase